MNNNKVELIIGGDFVPTDTNKNKVSSSDFINMLDEEFIKYWKNADFRIINLECVLCNDNRKKIKKCGPNIKTDMGCINGIKSLKPSVVLLANNHIFDYGEDGLKDTMEILDKNEIKYTGIIKDYNQKVEDVILEKNGLKIGIYNVCENEFSVATKERIGTNGLNVVKNLLEVKELKEKTDFVVVIFHGGKEYYRYPSPDCKKICEDFVDFGANMVITQHSHCIGCKEIYKNGTIIYGQGDFLFDREGNPIRKDSLIIKVIFSNKGCDIEYIPIEKYDSLFRINYKKNILEDFEKRSNEIKQDSFVQEKYSEFAKDSLEIYFQMINYDSLKVKLVNHLKNERYLTQLLNVLKCEAHRELLIKGLEEKLKEN